jgi:hypothetical protein
MKSQYSDIGVHEHPHTILWIFVIVLTAFGAVSIAALQGWIA